MRTFFKYGIILFLAGSCRNGKGKTSEKNGPRLAGNEIEHNIYSSGDSMLAAFRRKDWNGFVTYQHPNMIQRMGGVEAFASFVQLQMKQVADTSITDLSLGKILQVVKTPIDEQCVVEQKIQMQLEGFEVNKTTYLVGESLDKGKTWTFFDASTKTLLSPKEIKPDISPELQIPEAKN